jgi:ligand-binding SRPBCC domain-containing protein
MPTFSKSIIVEAPVETVFGFHEREDALRILSPRFPPVRVIRKTGGIEQGSRVELKVGPFLWTALHTDYEKNRLFVDEQIQGPFAKWVHRHEFESVNQTTRLTDRVEYRMPGGVWMNRLFGWAVQLGLRRMFRERHQITKRYCEKGK